MSAWLVKLFTSKTALAAMGAAIGLILQDPKHNWPAGVAAFLAALASVSTGEKAPQYPGPPSARGGRGR